MNRCLPWLLLALSGPASSACSGLARDLDARAHDIVADTSGDDASDSDEPLPDIGAQSCESDEDCAGLAQCCLDVKCQGGVCMPAYVFRCCTQEDAPCAVSTMLRTGQCETACVRKGCVESLSLGAERCDETVWELPLTSDGVAGLAINDPVADRVTWSLSTLRPFAGGPSLRMGDVLCPTYHTAVDPLTCAPEGESDVVELSFDTPSVTLPSDVPTELELWLYADLPDSDGLSTPLDGLELTVMAPPAAPIAIWSTRETPIPLKQWTPLLIDLSLWAGQPLQLRFGFDTLDGRDNDYEGIAFGRLRLRTACAADRTASDRDACDVAYPTAVRGLKDELVVFGPPDPTRACAACTVADTCARADTCDVAACRDGRCAVTREVTRECCTADARWPGDGSFEEALPTPAPDPDVAPDGWIISGAWAVSNLRSLAGESALHFGLTDGSGIAVPGQSAEGEALSPLLVVPEDAPRWRFALWLATEWDAASDPAALPSRTPDPIDNPAGIDLLEALVMPEAGVPVAPLPLWDSRVIGGTTLGTWVEVTVDLSRWAGQRVRLGWRFGTGDADANDAEGVYVDQSVVYRECPGCGDGQVTPGDPACE